MSTTVVLRTVIDRMTAGSPDAVRVPAAAPCHLDDIDLLAMVGRAEQPGLAAPGPAAVLSVFGRMLQRTRWALYRNSGRAAMAWSLGERLSVALVLGDQEALADLGYTPAEAAAAISTVLHVPSAEFHTWIGELRADL
jgi:hypothetical protein